MKAVLPEIPIQYVRDGVKAGVIRSYEAEIDHMFKFTPEEAEMAARAGTPDSDILNTTLETDPED